jgi:hypothetical protein
MYKIFWSLSCTVDGSQITFVAFASDLSRYTVPNDPVDALEYTGRVSNCSKVDMILSGAIQGLPAPNTHPLIVMIELVTKLFAK